MRYYPKFPLAIPHYWADSYALLTRPPLVASQQAEIATVRLACLRPAASVQSEPWSNSSVKSTWVTQVIFFAQTFAKLLNKFIQVCLSENFVDFQLKHPHALLDYFFKKRSKGPLWSGREFYRTLRLLQLFFLTYATTFEPQALIWGSMSSLG